MYTLFLTVMIVLAGQVSSDGGPRYQPAPGEPASRSVLPPQPGQLNPNSRPSGQQLPAKPLSVDNGRPLPARPSHVLASPESSATASPSKLIRNLLKPPATGRLAGSPLSLAEAVEGASSRGEQTRRIETYWDLSEATANYYLALREMIALQAMRRGIMQPSAQWEQARQSLAQRGQVARRSAETAQVRLQRMLGRAGSPLPLPSDFPHCGAYDTRFHEIFRGRLPSPEAQQFDELLSLAHQEIRSQAAQVEAAHGWRETVSQRRDPQTDGQVLLKAHELLGLSRRTFVQSLRSYNTNIARYAEIASPGQVDTGRLVAMLISSDANPDSAWSSGGIRRTSGEAEHSILTGPKH